MTKLTKNFNLLLFRCKCGCGYDDISFDLVNMLQDARLYSCCPYIITSGCRCKKHNSNVGGKADSAHLKGLAVDISYKTGYLLYNILAGLFHSGFKRIGLNLLKQFIHADVDYSKPYPTIYKY